MTKDPSQHGKFSLGSSTTTRLLHACQTPPKVERYFPAANKAEKIQQIIPHTFLNVQMRRDFFAVLDEVKWLIEPLLGNPQVQYGELARRRICQAKQLIEKRVPYAWLHLDSSQFADLAEHLEVTVRIQLKEMRYIYRTTIPSLLIKKPRTTKVGWEKASA